MRKLGSKQPGAGQKWRFFVSIWGKQGAACRYSHLFQNQQAHFVPKSERENRCKKRLVLELAEKRRKLTPEIYINRQISPQQVHYVNYSDLRQLKPATCRLVTQMGVCVRPPIGVCALASGVCSPFSHRSPMEANSLVLAKGCHEQHYHDTRAGCWAVF